MGVDFQLMDDCMDYVGDHDAFGKEVGIDLAEGKIILPLIHALRRRTPEERARVQAVLDKDEVSPEDLRGVSRLIEGYGGIAFTRAQARQRIDRAKAHLGCFPACAQHRALEAVADYVVSRDR